MQRQQERVFVPGVYIYFFLCVCFYFSNHCCFFFIFLKRDIRSPENFAPLYNFDRWYSNAQEARDHLRHSLLSVLEVVVESSLATIQAAQLIASDDTLNYPKLPVTPEELHGVKRMS